jgi:hypothetical protein
MRQMGAAEAAPDFLFLPYPPLWSIVPIGKRLIVLSVWSHGFEPREYEERGQFTTGNRTSKQLLG